MLKVESTKHDLFATFCAADFNDMRGPSKPKKKEKEREIKQ
jgi:hypothetical protein